MPSSRLPGIYTETEKTNSSSRRVSALATGVMLIDAHKGLIGERDIVTSAAEFVAKYGTFAEAANVDHHIAATAFLSQGQALYVTRVKRADTATTARYSFDKGTVNAHDPQADPTNSNDGTTITVFALNAGEWGNNLYARIHDFNSAASTYYLSVYTKKASKAVLLESWHVSNQYLKDGNGRQMHAEQLINGKSEYITVAINTHASALKLPTHKVQDEVLSAAGTLAKLDGTSSFSLVEGTFRAKEQAVGNYLISDDSKGVLSGLGGTGVINYETGEYSITYATGTTSLANYEYETFVQLQGGSNGLTPQQDDYVKALDIYRDKDDVAFEFLVEPSYLSNTYQEELAKLCEAREDCIAMLTVPTFEDMRDLLLWRLSSNIDTPYAILFAPNIQIKRDGSLVNTNAAPHAASTYVANTDANGPWSAVAGESNSQINCIGTTKRYTQDELLLLIRNQINPVVPHYLQGAVIYSQKTAQKATSNLQHAHAVRTLIFVRSNAGSYLRSKFFKLNNLELRKEVTAQLDQFLAIIQNNGGLSRYTVVCNGTNNPTPIRDAKRLNVDIYLTFVDVLQSLKITLSSDGQNVTSQVSTDL